MADNGEDLVSKVSVTGTEESTAKLDAFATQGAAAFDKLDKAAKKSSSEISRSAKSIETSSSQAAKGLNELGNVDTGAFKLLGPNLDLVERGTKGLINSLRSGIPALASFVTRLTALGTGAAAAGVGILKLAQNVAKGASTQESAIDKQTAAQVASNTASTQAQVAAINLESSQKQLFGQLQRGEISFEQYSKSLTQLNRDFTENQRVSAQTAAAQESLRLENERLQKQAADSKAFQAQADIFGGPLLSSLIALGNASSQVFTSFQQTFGPAISQGIDLITKVLNNNGTAIAKFFDEAGKRITAFISQNGPAIEQAFTTIGSVIKDVFNGVMDALPGLLTFFNNNLVPAVRAFGAALDAIAATINKVFGTQLTGGAILFLAILGQLTGAFQALFAVVRIFISLGALIAGLPFGPILLLVVAVITVLLIMFPQLRQVALDVFNSIVTAFKGMVAGAVSAGQGILAAWNGVIAFFTTLFTAIGQLFKDGWDLIVAGVTTTIDAVKAAWNTVVAFFQAILDQISAFFQTVWDAIVNSFNTAVNNIKAAFSDLLAAAKAKLQPIIDLLKTIFGLNAAVGGQNGPATVQAATGGHIRGPGTGTSDSIPAWLSDNEFVIKAKSVAKYGVGLLHAINSGNFRLPRLNVGGFVSSMINPGPRLAYADGGEVSSPTSMRPLSLTLFGEEFSGLLAPEDVGQRLTKFAVARQNKSAGRKPAWVGRGRN